MMTANFARPRIVSNRNVIVVLLLGLGLLAAYVLLFGWSFFGYPDPNPWALVVNAGPSAVTIQLWDGGPLYRSDCGTKQTFGEVGHSPPLPPWHIRVRDAANGRLLAETSAWGLNGWIAVHVGPREIVGMQHVADVHGSGPVPRCSGG